MLKMENLQYDKDVYSNVHQSLQQHYAPTIECVRLHNFMVITVDHKGVYQRDLIRAEWSEFGVHRPDLKLFNISQNILNLLSPNEKLENHITTARFFEKDSHTITTYGIWITS